MCACHCGGPLVLPGVCHHQSNDDSGDEIGTSCSYNPCEDDTYCSLDRGGGVQI